MDFLKLFGNNKILQVASVSWLIAQTIKVIHTFIVKKRFDFTRFVGSMLPKIEAAIKFVQSKDGRKTVITSLEKATEGMEGKTGTLIVNDKF